jgi:glycosyltransferase involved in cell wall biosynthesis
MSAAPKGRDVQVLAAHNDHLAQHCAEAEADPSRPRHHTWGIFELRASGHAVDIVRYGGWGGPAALVRRAVVLGDPEQELDVLRRRHRCDLVYTGSQNPMLGLAAARRLGLFATPIIAVLHRSYGRGALARLFVARVIAGYDRILCLSEPIRRDVLAVAPQLAARTRVAPWGIDLERFDRLDVDWSMADGPVFVTAGKTYRKLAPVLEAFRTSRHRLEVYYDDQQREAAHSAARDRVDGVAYRRSDFSWPSVARFNARARAVLVPLDAERAGRYPNAFGLTSMIDAMAAARPLIVTRTPGPVVDVEAEGIGIFVDGDDPDAWRSAVERLADDAALADEMGRRARRLCERRYDFGRFAASLCREVAALADAARIPDDGSGDVDAHDAR